MLLLRTCVRTSLPTLPRLAGAEFDGRRSGGASRVDRV